MDPTEQRAATLIDLESALSRQLEQFEDVQRMLRTLRDDAPSAELEQRTKRLERDVKGMRNDLDAMKQEISRLWARKPRKGFSLRLAFLQKAITVGDLVTVVIAACATATAIYLVLLR